MSAAEVVLLVVLGTFISACLVSIGWGLGWLSCKRNFLDPAFKLTQETLDNNDELIRLLKEVGA